MNSILSIKNMTYSIPYSHSILEDVNLEIGPGSFTGVLGHNGSGKTTLMDIILGLKKPSQGSIEVLGENPHSTERKGKDKIVFLSQDVSIKGNLSIESFLKFHSDFYPKYSTEDEGKLLEIFELDKKQKIGSLSTGQQKKVQVVAGLAARPELVLIDEITAVMDPETRDKFFQEILNVQMNHGASILLATNIAEDLINRANQVLFIEDRQASIHEPHEILNLFNVGEKAA